MCQMGVLIYIQPSLLLQQRYDLEQNLESMDGVLLAYFTAGRQHLLTVEYNPEKMNCNQVLQKVENCGVDANYYYY